MISVLIIPGSSSIGRVSLCFASTCLPPTNTSVSLPHPRNCHGVAVHYRTIFPWGHNLRLANSFLFFFVAYGVHSKSLDELVGLARGAPHGTWYWRLSVNPLNPDSGLGAVPLGPGFSPPGRIDQQTK